MNYIKLFKNEEEKIILIKTNRIFYFFPMLYSLLVGRFIDSVVFLITTLFIFPNVLYRIHLAKTSGIQKVKDFLNDGWIPDNKSKEYLLEKHIIYVEKPIDDGKIWMTNGITMEEVEIIHKQGFWKSIVSTTIIFFRVKMWWKGMIWVLANLTGVGDFIFTGVIYARFPIWRAKQLEKKGFRPHSKFDEEQINSFRIK